MTPSRTAAALMMVSLAPFAWSQTPLPPPQNVMNLSATATLDVPRDLLSVTFSTMRDGSDAAAVQSQLKQALDAALAEARRAARPGQVDVQTGAFSLYPRYAPKGGPSGWQGHAELIVEGRDSAAIAQLSGRIQTLTIARVSQGLSREVREKAEAEVAAQAIARFRARAEGFARQFGFSGYTIREVQVGGVDMPMPVPVRMRAAAQGAAQDESLPVEAGKSNVTVVVSGSVVMK